MLTACEVGTFFNNDGPTWLLSAKPHHSGKTAAATLDAPVVLPYDYRVAARCGELQAFAQLRGRPRPFNDTWIASCCLVRGLPLATFNQKDFADFADFAEHEGLELLPTG